MTEPENRWNPGAFPRQPSPELQATPLRTSLQDSAPSLSSEDEIYAYLGPGVAFHGTLSFSGAVRIEGQFVGSALGGRSLTIGDGAHVRGEIRADRVIILGGVVEAEIHARASIEIYLPAEVRGDLKAPEIYMDRGVRFQGTCDMSGADVSDPQSLP